MAELAQVVDESRRPLGACAAGRREVVRKEEDALHLRHRDLRHETAGAIRRVSMIGRRRDEANTLATTDRGRADRTSDSR